MYQQQRRAIASDDDVLAQSTGMDVLARERLAESSGQSGRPRNRAGTFRGGGLGFYAFLLIRMRGNSFAKARGCGQAKRGEHRAGPLEHATARKPLHVDHFFCSVVHSSMDSFISMWPSVGRDDGHPLCPPSPSPTSAAY